MSAETKFTPGPWKANIKRTVTDEPWCQVLNGAWDVPAGNPSVVADSRFSAMSAEENEANSHLIAAAPEMYHALEGLMKMLRWRGEGPSEGFDRIAEEFNIDTGMLPPGKDAGPMCAHTHEERAQKFEQWQLIKIDKAIGALAKARGETI